MYKKIDSIRKEIGKLSKDAYNPFHKSKYFDVNSLIEQVQPLLEKNNILLIQPCRGTKVYSILIDLDDGTELESWLDMASEGNPQKVGSSITYFRRYTLQSLLGLQAEDDDGNLAAGHVQPTTTQTKPNDDDKPWLNVKDKSGKETELWQKVFKAISDGRVTSLKQLRDHYKVSKASAEEINAITKWN